MSRWLWFRGQTWYALWVAMRRARRDARARRNLFRFLFSLAIFAAFLAAYFYMFYRFRMEEGSSAYWVIGVSLGFTILLTLAIALKQRLADRSAERTSPAVDPEIKRNFFREVCLLGLLLERLGSETAMEQEMPPGVEVITRRVLLERLDALDLRQGLEPWLLDLLLAPDGHWTPEQKQRAFPAWEAFAALRWALGLGELHSLTGPARYQGSDVRDLAKVTQPEKLRALPSWDLRPARDATANFFGRCWTELVARGEVQSSTEEDVEQAIELRCGIQEEGYTGDYLIGAETITEIDANLLRLATQRSYNRWRMLGLLVDILSGDEPPEALRRHLAQFFASPETIAALEPQSA